MTFLETFPRPHNLIDHIINALENPPEGFKFVLFTYGTNNPAGIVGYGEQYGFDPSGVKLCGCLATEVAHHLYPNQLQQAGGNVLLLIDCGISWAEQDLIENLDSFRYRTGIANTLNSLYPSENVIDKLNHLNIDNSLSTDCYYNENLRNQYLNMLREISSALVD